MKFKKKHDISVKEAIKLGCIRRVSLCSKCANSHGEEAIVHEAYWTDILTDSKCSNSMEALDAFFAAKAIEKENAKEEMAKLTNESIQFEKDNAEWCVKMRNAAKDKGWDSVKWNLRNQVMSAYDCDEEYGKKVSAAIVWAKENAGQNKISF